MLILASRSPRRSEILKQAGIPFVVRAADVDESLLPDESPEEYTQRVARMKAVAIDSGPEDVVVGADTTVVIDGKILAKPADAADAAGMLHLLSGRKHEVITGICLKSWGHTVSDWAVTWVWFAELSEDEIRAYVASGEPMDKAGAYAIQGLASKFVERVDGCFWNVVGLPISMVYRHLQSLPR